MKIQQENAVFAIYCYTCKKGFINLNHRQKQAFAVEHPGHKFTGMKKHE